MVTPRLRAALSNVFDQGLALPSFCNFQPKSIQIGLTVSTVVMLVILVICYATYGWVVDYSSLKCDFSLQEFKCDGGVSGKLEGKGKDEGDTMAGLGAMAFLFLFGDLVILVFLLLKLFTSHKNIMLMVAMVFVGLAWLFLTAGWGRYADSKGGADGSVDFGASFAFVVIMWLCLFPYAIFWFLLYNSSNDAASDQQAQADGTPDNQAYAGSAPSFTAHNGAADDTSKEAPAAAPTATATAEDTRA